MKREKEAGIKPETDIDIFMKVIVTLSEEVGLCKLLRLLLTVLLYLISSKISWGLGTSQWRDLRSFDSFMAIRSSETIWKVLLKAVLSSLSEQLS
jgi:hypothetical protein